MVQITSGTFTNVCKNIVRLEKLEKILINPFNVSIQDNTLLKRRNCFENHAEFSTLQVNSRLPHLMSSENVKDSANGRGSSELKA